MKVIIAGASIGGLLSAYRLGKAGHEVIVFDKKNYDELGYDWYDFVWHDFFDKLDMPDIDISFFRKNNMSFDIFGYDKILRLNQPEYAREYAVHRKQLSHFLYKKASGYSRIVLSKNVDSAIIGGDEIKGIVVDGENIYADLVIDNFGAFSPLRKHLSERLNIDNESKSKAVMFAYRGIFEKAKNYSAPEDDTKCYLRHLGQDGLSWVNVEENAIDVLIGRMKSLNADDAEGILSVLKKENPCIGEKLLAGGGIYPIPVSYPATKLFYGGYVLLGDSAFMTVPMLGSGIYSSVAAANILCETIENGDVSQKNLYVYQRRFYEKLGASFAELDVVKTFLLNSDISKLIILLKKGVVDEKDMTDIYNAKPFYYSLKDLIKKAIKGWRHPLLLLKMLGLLLDTGKIKKIMYKMPKEYDEKKLSAWRQKVRRFFEE